jgi:hypothetical protein
MSYATPSTEYNGEGTRDSSFRVTGSRLRA